MYVEFEGTMHRHRDEATSGLLLVLYGILQVGRPPSGDASNRAGRVFFNLDHSGST
jgi:hypothetical protein